MKPLAKALIARFGSFAEAIAAEPQRLAEVEGMSAGAIAEFKIVEAAAQRFAKGAVKKRLPMGSWSEVIDYCRTSMAFESARNLPRPVSRQEERADRRRGSRARAPSIIRRSIRAKWFGARCELSATAIVLVHNHPSGDPTPSTQDVKMTLDIIAIAKTFGRRRPRPHHRRPRRAFVAARHEADLMAGRAVARAHLPAPAAGPILYRSRQEKQREPYEGEAHDKREPRLYLGIFQSI